MASGGVPDVRVRLSAEGVQDVVNGLRRVAQEANRTGSGAKGVSVLTQAFRDLKSILPAIGVAAVVGGIVALGKSALENADHLGKLAIKTGANVETLSVLSLAATTADVEQDKLAVTMQRLVKGMSDASAGTGKAALGYRALGISQKEIRNTDPGEMFLKIADKLAKIESPARRAALAQQVLGKQGADMLPLLQDLANGGYDKVREKAERMGLVIDKDLAAAAQRANDALKDMSNVARGLATQFVAGLAPGVADAMESFDNSVAGSGVNGLRTLGEVAGEVTKFIVMSFRVAGATIAYILAWMENGVKTTAAVVKAFVAHPEQGLKAAAQAAGTAMMEGAGRQQAIETEYQNQLAAAWGDFKWGSGGTTSTAKGKGGVGNTSDMQAVMQARLQFLKAALDNELNLYRLSNGLAGDENERNYKNGLISLKDYFDNRRTLIESAAATEIDILQKKIELEKKTPAKDDADAIKKQQEISKLQNEIDAKRIEQKGKLAELDDEQANAVRARYIEDIGLSKQLAQAEGDLHDAAMLALDEEIAKTEELMRKRGVSQAEIDASKGRMREVGTARIDFNDAMEKARAAMAELDHSKAAISTDVERGAISGLEGVNRVHEAEQERLQTLWDIGAQLTANAEASKDPALIEQAKEYNAAVDQIEQSMNRVSSLGVQMANTLIPGFLDGFGNAFAAIVTGSQSAAEAFENMGKAMLAMIANLIARMMAFYLLLTVLRPFFPGLAAGLEKIGPFGSFAEGGYTGAGGRLQPAGIVHRGEYVVNADATRRYRPLLEAINSASGFALHGPRYATGGYVDGAGAPVTVNVINNTGQPVSQSQHTGPDGSEVVDIVIGGVAGDIMRGGPVGQAIQQTYGVSRRGARRG